MENYKFIGINAYGKRVKGITQAENPRMLEKRLSDTGIELLKFSEHRDSMFSLGSKRKASIQDVIAMTDELKMMLRAGVPLLDVLDGIQQNFPSDAIRNMVRDIFDRMHSGSTFSEGLEEYMDVFGDVYISLVKVGEETGQLVLVLEDLSEMITWQLALSSKAKKIMIYPSIVAVVVSAVVILMMVFVVPQLVSFISEMEGELGFATISLMATSSFIQNNIGLIILTPIVAVIVIKTAYKKSTAFKFWYDENILKFKLIGPIIHKLKIARLTNTLATMERSGLGIIESLELSKKVVANIFMEKQIITTSRLIQEGRLIHQAFSGSEILPPMAVRIIKAGEDSGLMGEAFANVSRVYDKQAKDLIDKIEPAIEPFLTIVLATVVGWVMIAVLGPIYDTISKVR